MKKLILDFEEPIEWKIIGISSQLVDYKLVFHVNKIHKTSFVRVDNFVVESGKSKVDYSLYYFNDEVNRIFIYMLSNKYNSHILVPEYRQFDYFLIIEGDADAKYLKEIIKKLRDINDVLFTQLIDTKNIKNFDVLAQAFELHLDKTGIIRND